MIYDPFGYKGYLGNAIANKRQNKFGSTSGSKRKARKLNLEEDAIVDDGDDEQQPSVDGELSEDDATALKQLLQTMNVRQAQFLLISFNERIPLQLSSASEAVYVEANKNMLKLQLHRRREIHGDSKMTATQIIQGYPMLITIPDWVQILLSYSNFLM